MTKQLPRKPEPSTDTGYDSYLIPRSKTPALTELYEALLELGWRFDSHYVEWHTPERDTLQGFGRLQYDPDYSWAKVQPPILNPSGTEIGTLPPPIIELKRVASARSNIPGMWLEVDTCQVCSEPVEKINGTWFHYHGGEHCGTGDGAFATPMRSARARA